MCSDRSRSKGSASVLSLGVGMECTCGWWNEMMGACTRNDNHEEIRIVWKL